MRILNQKPTDKSIMEHRLLLGFLSADQLRLTLGLLGMILPLILYIGNDNMVLTSISAYYYSNMKWVFVGFFVLYGWMLIAYKGFPESTDDKASFIAGIASIGIAVFPTHRDSTGYQWYSILHLVFVFGFILTLIYMSWSLFTINPKGKWKKMLYKLSAIVMFLAMLGIISSELFDFRPVTNPAFWFELLAIEFFGFSWLVKGI